MANIFKKIYRGFKESDATNQQLNCNQVRGAGSWSNAFNATDESSGKIGAAAVASDRMEVWSLPADRFSQYEVFNDMASFDVISAALMMHLSNALAPEIKNGRIFTINASSDDFDDVAKELNTDLNAMITKVLPSMAYMAMVNGVQYGRVYLSEGTGISHIDTNYYTTAGQIAEFERSGQLVGYCSRDQLYSKDDQGNPVPVPLAQPWLLLSCKIPFFKISMDTPPLSTGNQQYNLLDNADERDPVETQNYGTSFLVDAVAAYRELKENLRSMNAARRLTGRVDRYVSVGLGTLDKAKAANYFNTITAQFSADIEKENQLANKRGWIPTIITKLLPVYSNNQGSYSVDNQQISPNINAIEDIKFNLNRMCAGLGIDPTMLGWADTMAGGLGDGGWDRTSINAAMRANWIRTAVRNMIVNACQVHWMAKHKKYLPESAITIEFEAAETALAAEKAAEHDSNVASATAVVSLIDLITQGSTIKSATACRKLFGMCGFDTESIDQILDELSSQSDDSASPPESDSPSLESIYQFLINQQEVENGTAV